MICSSSAFVYFRTMYIFAFNCSDVCDAVRCLRRRGVVRNGISSMTVQKDLKDKLVAAWDFCGINIINFINLLKGVFSIFYTFVTCSGMKPLCYINELGYFIYSLMVDLQGVNLNYLCLLKMFNNLFLSYH
jgi:hypothetical protein